MGVYAVCDIAVREAAEEGGDYFRGILTRFVERRDCKVAIDSDGNRVINAYARHAKDSKIGGKNISDWLRMLALSYAHNFERIDVPTEVLTGPSLFTMLAGGIAADPKLIVWSSNHYPFVRENMPRVRIYDRDQAIEELADPKIEDKGDLVVNETHHHHGDTFMGISDSTIINRSKVSDAFNAVRERDGDEVAQALVELAQEVASSDNVPAQAVFESFRREVAKPTPEKGLLKKLWDGLLSLTDGAAKIADLGLKLAPLWS